MATAQNGYSANDRTVIASYTVPGGKLALRRGPAGELLAEAVRRWHAEVEPLVWPGVWGYAERLVRGGTDVSNHAAGCAADCNAPAHPLAADPARSFTAAKLAAVRRIIADSGGCLRWGGDYSGRKDGMHLEVIAPEAKCAEVLARWRGQPTAAAAAPAAVGAVLATLRQGAKGDERVRKLQAFLNRYPWKPSLPILPVSGNYLEQTVAVVKAAQAQCGVTGSDADGTVIGPRTSSAFAARGASW